jgi:hypothetical protein
LALFIVHPNLLRRNAFDSTGLQGEQGFDPTHRIIVLKNKGLRNRHGKSTTVLHCSENAAKLFSRP